MRLSWKLGRIAGIDVFVHSTFLLVPLFLLWQGRDLLDLLLTLSIFGCVVLHEFGHALMARRFGIETNDITLYPIGGVARLRRLPRAPGAELLIALAGPAVNFAIVGALMVLGSLGFGQALPPEAGQFFFYLAIANAFLGLFNLIPAFPMDGGRVLRAVLATGMNRVRATEVAVAVGSLVAVGGVVFGILAGQYTLVAVAIVVFLLGQAELAAVKAQAAARQWREAAEDFYRYPPDESAAPPEPRGFTGLVWNAERRVWVQYQDGHVVRVIDPGT